MSDPNCNSRSANCNRAGCRRDACTTRGFTLMEMLVVISIITILGGLVLAALGTARRAARERATEATLTLLKGALDRYEMDYQDYPPSDGDLEGIKGSESLWRCLRSEKKEGPYIQAADIKNCDFDKNGDLEVADSFNRPIRYVHHRDYQNKPPNKRTYRLISSGANVEYEEGSKRSDDIVNWNKDRPE